MELHTAIRGILRMQGQDFVFNPGFVNALEDFNAFEHNLAYKNVLKIVIQEGYATKLMNIGNWDIKAQQLSADAVSKYAFDSTICEYVIKSLAYGLGLCKDIPSPNPQSSGKGGVTGSSGPTQNVKNLSKSRKEIERMSDEERDQYANDAQDYLDGIIEMEGDWKQELGASFSITSSVTFYDDGDGRVRFRIEINGKIPFNNRNYIEFVGAIYNDKGRIIGRVDVTKFESNHKRLEVLETDWIDAKEYRDISRISKVVFYWDEH